MIVTRVRTSSKTITDSEGIKLEDIDKVLFPYKSWSKDIFIIVDSEVLERVRKMLNKLVRHEVIYNNPHFSNSMVVENNLDVMFLYRNGTNVFFADEDNFNKLADLIGKTRDKNNKMEYDGI